MVIGLTGNIGCGKSSVAKILIKLGAKVIDADAISKSITDPANPENKSVLFEIQNEFGTIDRTAIREVIFQNESKRKTLEKILHPIIRSKVFSEINNLKTQNIKLIVYEAPLLIEAGIPKELEGILLITCDPKIQLERVLKRDPHLNNEMATKIINSQLSQNEKKKHSKWIIDNSKNAIELEKNITQWFKTLQLPA